MASVTTDDSVATTPDAADVAELILAYDRALALARTRSRLVAVRTRVPRDGRADRLWQVRWLRWPVEHFIAWHVTRTLNALHRALSRRVATGQADERDIADRETVAAYRDSMRPVHVKSYLAIVIVLTLLIGGFILKAAGPVLSDLPVLRFAEEYDAGFAEGAEAERRDVIEISDRTSNLFASFGDAISADVSSLGDTVEAFVGAEPSDSALVLAGFLFSLYLVTRILVPAYRLKRMLFNLADDPRGLSYSTARWNVKHATGVYRRERAVFASVDERLPREPPLDLLIPALWLSLPVALAVYLFRNTHDWIFSQPAGFWLLGIPFEFSVALATGLVTLSAVRIVWLGLTWWARRRSSTSLTPFEVRAEPRGRRGARLPRALLPAVLVGDRQPPAVACRRSPAVGVSLALVPGVPEVAAGARSAGRDLPRPQPVAAAHRATGVGDRAEDGMGNGQEALLARRARLHRGPGADPEHQCARRAVTDHAADHRRHPQQLAGTERRGPHHVDLGAGVRGRVRPGTVERGARASRRADHGRT
jgi:hypothetical protein